MTEIISRNEFDKSYLLIQKEIPENNYIFNMLTKNNIPGIPECKIRYLDDNTFFAYDVTGKKTLVKMYADRKMVFEDLAELFYGIRKIMHCANEYLLDRSGFLLQPKYMFTDLETGELSCLYYFREDNTEKEERYRALADFLLDKIDHKDEHAVNITYHFYKISKEEFINNIFDIDNYLKDKEEYIDNYLLPLKFGTVSMASKTNALIVPYAITGTYKFRSKDLTINIGKPFKVDDDLEKSNKKLDKEIKKLVKENLKK